MAIAGNIFDGTGVFSVIGAGSILCLCFYNRLTIIVERMRAFDRELIEAYSKRIGQDARDMFGTMVVQSAKRQLKTLVCQAYTVKYAILSTLFSFVLVMVNSIVIASGVENAEVVRGLHYGSVGFLILGVCLSMSEMAVVLGTVSEEVDMVVQNEFGPVGDGVMRGLNP
jgi:hypothetical protein